MSISASYHALGHLKGHHKLPQDFPIHLFEYLVISQHRLLLVQMVLKTFTELFLSGHLPHVSLAMKLCFVRLSLVMGSSFVVVKQVAAYMNSSNFLTVLFTNSFVPLTFGKVGFVLTLEMALSGASDLALLDVWKKKKSGK